eukprot:UN12010
MRFKHEVIFAFFYVKFTFWFTKIRHLKNRCFRSP